MTAQALTSKLELHGAAATSSPHSLIYLPPIISDDNEHAQESVLFPSNCIVNVAKIIKEDNSGKIEKDVNELNSHENESSVLYNVNTTLRTCTVPRDKDCMIRSITSMALLKHVSDKEATSSSDSSLLNIVACAYSDGSLTVWKHIERHDCNDCYWEEDVVVGITTGDEIDDDEEEECFDSITDVHGIYTMSPIFLSRDDESQANEQGNIECIILTSSSKGLKYYRYKTSIRTKDGDDCVARHQRVKNKYSKTIARYPTASMKLTFSNTGNQLILAVGTAMPRNNRIQFYTLSLNNNDPFNDWIHQGSLLGHLGWVSCLDWLYEGDSLMLASGSHDARIRLWKFHPLVFCDENIAAMENAGQEVDDIEGSTLDENEEEKDDADEDMEEGEARLFIRYKVDGVMMQRGVTLEALLIGHEEQVTAVSWRPKSLKPCLISASMDRSILIWMEENDYTNDETIAIDGVGNVWAPITRVGTAGGILGGSVGSSLLGFVNVVWNKEGDQIIGHGYGGSVYFWSRYGNGNDDTDMERWRANPCLTGHFRGCSDISWEVTEGLYLLSAGLDQTCRLWIDLPNVTSLKERLWREVGRPQVHGYDLNTVECIGDGNNEMKHRFVGGADEKEARSFDAPVSTLKLLTLIRGTKLQDDKERVERAFIPSLGLSNRATADDAMEEDSYAANGGDKMTADSYNIDTETKALSSLQDMIDLLPHERDLGVTSLWPEVRKLYGHQTELICLASNACHISRGDKALLASSCKARDAENACIRIWNVEKNMCIAILKGGHKSTVTSLSFSSDGKFIASSGKDRRLCLWKISNSDEGTKVELAFMIESAHKRIVWSLDFCPNKPDTLCTGSRDGFLKLWHIRDRCGDNEQVEVREIHKWEPSRKKSLKVEPITAVAFAPRLLQKSMILAVGLENGLIELWGIPADVLNAQNSCKLLHLIPTMDCHISSITKLAWKPDKKANNPSDWHSTLASCSTDHGVRIFCIKSSV